MIEETKINEKMAVFQAKNSNLMKILKKFQKGNLRVEKAMTMMMISDPKFHSSGS